MLLSKNAIKFSIYITLQLIGYFLILDFFGLGDKIYLSFFNSIILSVGLFFVIKNVYYREGEKFDYMDGFMAAISTGFLSTILFSIFMAFYLFQINKELASTIKDQLNTLQNGSSFNIILFIALSGFATTLVAALVILPLYKQSWNTRKVRQEQKPLNQK